MPACIARLHTRLALLASLAILAVAAPAGAATGVTQVYGGGAAASGTSDADIDAVPGLRAQIERGAEAGSASTPRVLHGTTADDIDAVPGLRAQLVRQAEAGRAPAAASDDDAFQWGDAAIGAGGVLAALAAAGVAGTAMRRRGGATPAIG